MITKGPTPRPWMGDSIKPTAVNYIHPAIIGSLAFILWMGQCSWTPSPLVTVIQIVPYHVQKQNLRSLSPGLGMLGARGDRQGHVWYDLGISDGGLSRCIIKRQPEVVPTIFSLSWLISDSLFTLQPVHISKSCSHQSMTPSPYEEISDQLALIRAVLVSSIISVSLFHSAIHRNECMCITTYACTKAHSHRHQI